MSGTALSPWYVGESNDESDALVLEIYSANEGSAPVAGYLPSIMLVGLEYKQVAPSRITVELHPGENPVSASAPWWGNFFNRIHRNETWDLTVSPFSPGLARKASDKLPYLFDADGDNVTSTSWGLMEAAALISVFAEENAQWKKISIDGQERIVD